MNYEWIGKTIKKSDQKKTTKQQIKVKFLHVNKKSFSLYFKIRV